MDAVIDIRPFSRTTESLSVCDKIDSCNPALLLPRLLRIAAHDLDLLSRDIVLIVKLKIDIFDEKGPDFVAEAVGIQMTLFMTSSLAMIP